MTKKILYIILGAILVFGLLFLLWSWLFSGGGINTQNNGQFGTSTNATQNAGTGGSSNNGEANLGQNASNGIVTLGNSAGQNTEAGGSSLNGGNTGSGTNGSGSAGTGSTGTNGTGAGGTNGTGSTGNGTNGGGTLGSGNTNTPGITNGVGTLGNGNANTPGIGTNGSGSTGGTSGGTNGGGSTGSGTTGSGTFGTGTIGSTTGGTIFTISSPMVQGVDWLNTAGTGGTIGGTGAQLNGFTPIGINNINGGSLGGTVPTIGGTVSSGSGSNSDLSMLLATGLIGAASCALQASGNTIGALLGIGGGAAAGGAVTGVPVSDLVSHTALGAQVGNSATHNTITFAGCITNVLAKAALQQITASVVNWINSGFNGNPSFVNNYQQFFTNVADLAAGQFIQGAGLSFLCSPFQLQIKVAVAQSYANRGAQSCTLTKVIGNINSFMNGNFAQGGWPGMLSFTTTPTNNPYGAYTYAQIGLVSAQNTALANAKNNISPTGFLNMTQQTCSGTTNPSVSVSSGAHSQAASVSCPAGCTCKVTTPGGVIAASLDKTLGSGVDQLGLASDLDQIINALTTQLITKTLQGGLSNLSGTTGLQSAYQTPDELAAQTQAQGILTNLQAQITYAEQYGTILQGSISDIEGAQNQLNNLSNCWITAAAASSTASQTTAANANASTTEDTLNSLTPQINAYNDAITGVNAEIATIQQLQSEALTIGSTANVQTLTNNYTTAQSAQPFIGSADVTTAQQNRTTLQSQLAATNTTTAAGLAQCQAFGQSQ